MFFWGEFVERRGVLKEWRRRTEKIYLHHLSIALLVFESPVTAVVHCYEVAELHHSDSGSFELGNSGWFGLEEGV